MATKKQGYGWLWVNLAIIIACLYGGLAEHPLAFLAIGAGFMGGFTSAHAQAENEKNGF